MSKSINDIKIPNTLDEKMVKVAKFYVQNKLKDGFTKDAMFKELSISSKTFYVYLENPDFQRYVNEMDEILIPSDELEAVRKFKKKILKLAEKDNMTSNEMKHFSETFKHIIEADNRIQAEKLGLNITGGSGGSKYSDTTSIEERQRVILDRLKK
ncbi:phBC6A51 family helix-turn-helix protein [Sutcliffiella deserti]|uniref:phBC6A51 family helix-turn-helix protein n=1 Tax=Sutcliffiella deserti TaxID=2875501 RepID=UPI001CBBA712|nr:phBC6A51 family helix-turn-helix protein [Sutcliffiella deserti]